MEILSRPVAFRAIAAATAVLLALGLIGVVTVNDSVDTLDATGSTTTTTASGPGATLAPVPGAPVQPGSPAPTAPGAPAATQPGPTTTAAPPATDKPAEATPTRPGLYRYKNTVDGKESRSELRVTQEAGGPAGEQRLLHRKTSDGNTTEASIAWRANGVFERSRTFPGGEGEAGAPCDWEPDVLLAPRPLRLESTWSWDSRCSSQVQGQQADFHFTGQARVTEAVRASVGGRAVTAWRIQSTAKIEITGNYQGQPFTVVVDITSDDQFAPQQGILVRSDSTTKATGPGSPPNETRTLEELQNLDPA
ncbi:MAG TPA: hypothetical protein VMY88_10635 [Acidimicrobiales bacterium]|nr:hypothetical protein [Acidimicrobiales bacterium]